MSFSADRRCLTALWIGALWIGALWIGAVGCGAVAPPPPDEDACWRERFPVVPCAGATDLERVGVWTDTGPRTGGALSYVYDGCTVAFTYRGDMRANPYRFYHAQGAVIGIEYQEYGDPDPYYLATVEWRGDDLVASSFIAPSLSLGRWDGARFVMTWGPMFPMRRITDPADLDENARAQLCVRRRAPTEAEILRRRGFPADASPGFL